MPESFFPLSPAQLGMWFAQHVDPSVPANIAQYVELRGELDLALLERSSSAAALELQSGFVRIVEVDAEPRQLVDPTLDDKLGYLDLRHNDDPRAAALEWMRADYSAPIDVLRDRLIAATVLHVEDDVYFWYERVHHVVLDGFGAVTFMNRAAELYTAAIEGSEPKKNLASDLRKVYDIDVDYRDSTRFQSDRDYWADRIDGVDSPTTLAGRTAAPAAVSQIDTTSLSPSSVAAIDKLTEATGTTLASVVIAGFAAYLAQMTGREDVVLSLPVTARTTAVLRRSGGMVSNVVPLRLEMSSETTVQDLLARVGTEVTGALRHQRYRHEDIRRDAGTTTGQASFFGPWVNIMLFFGEVRLGSMVGGINILSTGLIEDFGLNLYTSVAGSKTHIDFESNPNLYSSEESARNHTRFVSFFDTFVEASPDTRVWDLDLLTETERTLVLRSWNDTERQVDSRTLLSDFYARVDADPAATALVYENDSIDYGEFGARVSGLARLLIAQGVGPEVLVGLSIRRSIDLVVAMYAIVEAGGAWVPIDPDHPGDRTAYILDSAQPLCVLTVARDGVDLPNGTRIVEVDEIAYERLDSRRVDDSDRISPLRLTNTAYVIYTSGSTGRPKGVAVSHEAIDNQLQWMGAEYGLDSSDVYLQKTATTFDVSLWGFFLPLQVGATMVLATPDGHRDSIYVADKIAEHGVTVTDFVPSMLTVFTANAPAGTCGSLRHVFVIGEALPAETAAAFRAMSSAGLHNLYGPTEAAVSVTYHQSTTDDVRVVPIGVPEWNTRAFVLDGSLRPSPVGEAGELYLAGVQLARGYLRRPDLTSDRFVADPFSHSGDRMYRTGDLVRWRPDGNIEYIGRTDFQVKFRGQRIELGEIETVLLAHPALSQCITLVAATATGDQLVAYVVPAPGQAVEPETLTEFASRSLPVYMVPASIMVLAEVPLNTSGKLDRRALPEPVFSSARAYRAPQSRIEYVVAGVFEDVLGASHVGLDEDFFELGGNSLIATQLVTRVGSALGIRIGVRELFEAPTVGALASRAQSAMEHGSAGPELIAGERPDVLPLSLAQQRMWFLNRFDPSQAVYNLPFTVSLAGRVDLDALRRGLGAVVARHESLRTVYPEIDGSARQVILAPDESAPELIPVEVTREGLQHELVGLATRGFDLAVELPFRVAVFELSSSEYVLAMVLHHIAADGFSFGPLAGDVVSAYSSFARDRPLDWKPLSLQYADYALWQRELLGSESDPGSVASKQISYWRAILSGLPDQLDLPADRPRPAAATYHGSKHRFEIGSELHEKLTDLARANNASLFMVFHAAYSVLLARLSGTDDIAVGSPIAGRGQAALDDLIGMFVNTLVLRTRVSPADAFTRLLARVRDTDLSAYAHADVPFERVVEVLNPERSTARHPLFQVALSIEAAHATETDVAGLRARAAELDLPISKFDMQLSLVENHRPDGGAAGVNAVIEYATDLFDESTVASFAARFVRILDAVVVDPSVAVGDIEILDGFEREFVVSRWNASGDGEPDVGGSLVDVFDAQVVRFGSSVAVRFGGESLSYAELDSRVNRLARHLISLGVGPESLVAVALPRSVELVVALLAVVKAGGGYLPVDPNYPADRIEFMVSDAAPVCVVSSGGVGFGVPLDVPVVDLDVVDLSGVDDSPVVDGERLASLSAANVAYVIYTSGSTGRPKGVLVPHRNVLRLFANTASSYGFDSSDVWSMFHSYAFDFSVWELWGPLLHGGSLVVVDYFTSRSPEAFRELLVAEGVTVLNQTPSAFHQLSEADRVAGSSGLALRYVIFGGEALELRRLSGWFDRHGDVVPRLVNMYGITETTVHVSYRELSAELASSVSASVVGSPIAGLRVYVLDSRLNPVPVGVPGEMYVAGGQLARGYLGRADLTSVRFVADPFGGAGSLLYRTGDVARWGVGGDLEYLGRADDQVKVRGFRIELGEIEVAVSAQESVAQAAVVVREDVPGSARLVAYVVPGSGGVVDVDAVRGGVGELLPEYMVPSAFVVIDAIPLTVNGKLDRRALPEPLFEVREFRAPTTPIEEIVAGTFADVLGVERVGLDDDFFALGGNSLIATQVVSRLGVALDAQVPVRALFEASTVAGLATRVEQHSGTGGRRALVAGERPDRIPLSLAQQRMWFLNRFQPDSATYNLPFALRLTGALDVAAMQVSIMDVIDRHESLRTVYPDSPEGPQQVVLDAAQIVPNLYPITVDQNSLQDEVVSIASRGFDVTSEVPIRASLFELSPTEHVLVIVVHHISADGWSMGPVARDVMIAYAARTEWERPGWAPLPVQYADYTLWQRELLGSEEDPESLISSQVEYWTERLQSLPDQLDLPFDYSRPAQQSFAGGRTRFTISAEMHRALLDVARINNASLFMVVHSALAVLLGRLSGTEDIVIGTPVAGRGEVAVEDLVGMFVNTLVLRTEVEPSRSFTGLLAEAREAALGAFSHADVPFERLVEVLNPTRSTARHPLFQVVLSFENLRTTHVDLAGLSLDNLELDAAVAKFDLQLTLSESVGEGGIGEGLSAEFTYATDLFDEHTVASFAARFVRILDAVVVDPSVAVGDIEILDGFEREFVVSRWNASGDGEPDVGGSLVDVFDAQVVRFGSSVAVRFGGESLSYAELDSRVNRLARHLISLGVGPESLVAVALPRSVELVVALLAVVKAGGGYLPVDPNYPADRIEFMVSDAAPVCVVSSGGVGFGVPLDVPVVDLDVVDLSGVDDSPVVDGERLASLSAANVAYVIYTSGSTGRPKGVLVPHRNVLRLFANTASSYGFDSSDVWSMFHSYAFDFSVWELWGPLLHGGSLVVVDYFTSRSPEAFRELLVAEGVTVLNQTPSAFHQLSEADRVAGSSGLALRYVIFGGEALELRRLSGWFDRHGDVVPRLVNMYGITETTVHVSYRELSAELASSVSASVVGSPIAGLRVYVLDSRLNPVPVGVPGEMYVAGGQLARGYLGRADLTSVRFVADPFGGAGSLLYRTGDVARWGVGGDLEYLGRADDQVKVRGFRIELGEIEVAVSAQESVAQAAVVVREDVPGSARLVAYVVPGSGGVVDVDAVRGGVGELLPEYMVPSAFVVIDAIPLTVNGKLDRRALPEPLFEVREFRAPTTPIEEIVAGTFADVLGVERVGLDDDFFALGGNSLIATQVVSRLGVALDAQVPVRALFEASTVAGLATRVEQHSGTGGRRALVAGERPDRIPLSLAQQRMWFLNRFDSASTAYNIPFALRLSGDLDIDALRGAVGDVIDRHESLRTVYPDSPEGPVQSVRPSGRVQHSVELVDVDSADVPARVREFVSTPFDVTREIPIRVTLYRVGPDEFVLAMVAHHISADGSSMVPMTRDIMAAYASRTDGTDPVWPRLDVQYADYAVWQRELLGSEDDPDSLVSTELAYWRSALADLPDQLDLPFDRPRPKNQTYRGSRVEFEIDAETTRALSGVARRQNATVFMAVHAAFAIVLSRLSGTSDISVGTPIAGRTEPAVEDLIGMFVNTLVFRLQVDGDLSFEGLLAQARETDLHAFAHAEVPFERLVEVLNPARSTARHPLFQVGFSFQNFEQRSLELSGLTITPFGIESENSQFDLHLIVFDAGTEGHGGGAMSALMTYASDLFDASTVRIFVDRFLSVLRAVVADPSVVIGDLDILRPLEREQLVTGWNATSHPVETAATLVDLFHEQVRADPAAIALEYEGSTITYGDFSARVNRLARHLVRNGVGPESLVGLAVRRSIDLVVGMYAVVTAGGAYVPLDPDQPAERNTHILDTADPVCVLTVSADAAALSTAATVVELDRTDLGGYSAETVTDAERLSPLHSSSTAYVIFTSGSTGKPKGVAVPHSAIVNQLEWKRDEYSVGAGDSVLLKTVATFDLSVWEFWSALTSGARLVIATADGHKDPDYLVGLLRSSEVTTLHVVPSMLSMLMSVTAGEVSPHLKRVLAIGEALPPSTARQFLAENSGELYNLYGPTEAAVSITAHQVSEQDSDVVPIGVPEWNSEVLVLDSRLHPAPIGVVGELYLAGRQLARGYYGRQDLTAERFVSNPYGDAGSRMYRTGDLVRWRSARTPDGVDTAGTLVYVERADFQVKLRGFRIELGEIESVLRSIDGVDDVAVVVQEHPTVGDRIVAYLVPVSEVTLDVAAVNSRVAQSLPSYMVPSAILVLDALPLNVNGKLDRRALPTPEIDAAEFRAPTTPIEEVVASTVAEVLDVPRAGLDDDFFALGGNSLVATQLVARLGGALDAQIPVRLVFEAPTVHALAERISPLVGGGARPELVAGERPDTLPLSLAQQRMWTINRVDPASSAYNIPVAVRLRGELDVDILFSSIGDLVARHEVLRTRYPETDDGPIQVIVDAADATPTPVVEDVDPAGVLARVEELFGRGFDVTEEVPVRIALYRLAADEYVLAIVAHHISADGFSMRPLVRDLMIAYVSRTKGEEPGWPPLDVQYADFGLWQRRVLGEESDPTSVLSRQIAYWTEQLDGVPEQLPLPVDTPRAAGRSTAGGTVEFRVGSDIATRVETTSREHGATVFMAVHGALTVLLSKLTNTADIAVGTPIAGRGEQRLDDVIGMFVNTLVLRTTVQAGTEFAALLDHTRDIDLAAFGNADVPFEMLVDALGRPRSSAYTPLFQVMLTFANVESGTLALPGLDVEELQLDVDQAKFDLQLTAFEEFDVDGSLEDIRFVFTYATSIFRRDTVQTFAERFTRILDAVTKDTTITVRDIDMMSEQEKALFAPKKPRTTADLPELAAAAAALAPDATAFEHEGRVITFGELSSKFSDVTRTMGATMKPEALVTVALSGLVPGILPALGAQGYAQLLASLNERADSVVASAQTNT